MTPERWQHIDTLFHSALECAPAERASFLSQACRTDEDLRSEVESLLRAHQQDGAFLDAPAYELAAESLADGFVGALAGEQIGPYEILSPLAFGGMGEVYLAQDSRLGRKIALKLLPLDFARDQHRVRRFAQEARAASALNHPNVCVIHEIGQTKDGRHFIAMEHVDGMTLRERIAQGPLKLSEALAVAEQIAAALAAAHAAGVVHRDIKPENIMLRKDGYVKVLDFGLAKLNESQSQPRSVNEAPTIDITEPGTQMGTVRYMSPEQLREGPVDERTDVWSFGVVLHEMITGYAPFEARSRNETIAAILKRQPTRLAFSGDEAPEEFRQIIAKALSKKRAERYQTINDLAADLKNFRRQFLGESTSEPSLPQAQIMAAIAAGKPRMISKSSESKTRHKRRVPRGGTSDLWSSALTYISRTAEQILTDVKQHPKATIFAGLIAVFAIFMGLNSRRFLTQQPPAAPFQTIKMTPLTNSGQSVCAAISPDGKSVAHAEKKDGLQQVVLTNIANAGSIVIVPPADVTYLGVTFSHDGNYLYFTRSEKSDAGSLYQVALPGSAARKIKDGVDTPISFSPSGDRFSFVRVNRPSREYSLIIAGADGSDERTIATRRAANTIYVGPAWSPDGRTIACVAGKWENGLHTSLVEFEVESGRERSIGRRQWSSIFQVSWLDDESGLIVCAREQPVSPIQMWRVSYPGGNEVRITNDTSNYETVSVSHDTKTIVAIQSRQEAQIWVAPDGDAQRGRPIASTVGRTFGLDWSSNGTIVFSSMAGMNLNISSINPDGSNQIQLTANAGDNYTPAVSRDGRLIVFASNRNQSLNIWRMNAGDGSDPKQLTFSDGNSYPSLSPDGQSIVFDNQSDRNPTFTVWKVPADSGTAVQLTDYYARMPIVSPDGRFIACRYLAEQGSREIAIFPFEGGGPIQRLPIPIIDWQRLQWIPDGSALTYINSANGASNIWRYDIRDRSSKQLTDFKTDQIFAYAWSPDFKQLACLRGSEPRDVTIINDQK